MIKISRVMHGIQLMHVWYAKEEEGEEGIIQYRQALFHPPKDYAKFETLISDLTLEETELLNQISKNGRYEIRRAQKEGVETLMKSGENLTKEDIYEFCDFFVEFWKSKGIDYTQKDLLQEEILQYAQSGYFAISAAMINQKTYVYHTYLLDHDTVRLYHSSSLYRVEEEIPKKLIGMANRLLHKEDMLYFKNAGYKQYDWGGAGTDEEVANITEFKKSFGGTPAVFYDFTLTRGEKAKLIHTVSTIKRHIQKRKASNEL